MVQKGKARKKIKREKPEFDQQIVDLARVTRVTGGGKQLSFRALLVIGDRKGRVGYGLEKGKDVQIAVDKAYNQAKKNLINIPIIHDTIPHTVESKYKAAKILLKPAPVGSGIIAGSVVRTVLEMGGVQNASAKMIGRTNNKVTNVKAVFEALQSFKKSALKNVKPAVKSIKKEVVENKKIEGKPRIRKTAPKKIKSE